MSYGFIRRNEKKNSGITLKFGIEIEVPAYPFEKRKIHVITEGVLLTLPVIL